MLHHFLGKRYNHHSFHDIKPLQQPSNLYQTFFIFVYHSRFLVKTFNVSRAKWSRVRKLRRSNRWLCFHSVVSFQVVRMYVECGHWILQSSERGCKYSYKSCFLTVIFPEFRRATPFVLHCKECCVTSPRTGSRKAGFLFAVKIPLRQVVHKLLSTSPTGFLNDCFIARERWEKGCRPLKANAFN